MKPDPAELEAIRRRHAAEDDCLKQSICNDMARRLAGYDIFTRATVMPDRKTGRLHIVLNCSITYELARTMEVRCDSGEQPNSITSRGTSITGSDQRRGPGARRFSAANSRKVSSDRQQ